MNRISVKTVVAIGITAAIFFVLMRFVAIPTGVPNTSFVPAYALLAMMAAIFGPLVGLFGGFIGHVLADVTSYGIWWSWEIATGVFGCLVGLFFKQYLVERGGFKLPQMIRFNVIQLLSVLVCWGLVAPGLDILIYKEPVDKVFTQGLVAGASDFITVLVLGTLLLFLYSKMKAGSTGLKKEG